MRYSRQNKILELITTNTVETQEQLCQLLKDAGYDVTQATVSRDIKQLRIIKALDSFGNYRYVSQMRDEALGERESDSHYNAIFKRSVITVDCAFNDIVIKCHAGMASGACVAVDYFFSGMIMGSLAGDDTILVITKTPEIAKQLTEKLLAMCKD